MTCSQTRAGVAIEILVKEQVIAPMFILLKLRVSVEDGPPPGGAALENRSQAPRQLHTYIPQVQMAPRPRWAFDREAVTEIPVEFLQRFNDQIVDRKPNRAAPVRVAAEQPRG